METRALAIAFFIGAAVMAIGELVELAVGVKAEQQDLESIAKPLTAQDAEQEERPAERAADEPDPSRPRREEAAEVPATGPGRTRRYRIGPGRPGSSPGMAVSAPIPAVEFSREIARIEQARAEHGPTERRELARLVGARFWGPGRFPAALREAVLSGKAKRIDRNRFGPAG